MARKTMARAIEPFLVDRRRHQRRGLAFERHPCTLDYIAIRRIGARNRGTAWLDVRWLQAPNLKDVNRAGWRALSCPPGSQPRGHRAEPGRRRIQRAAIANYHQPGFCAAQ